MNKRASLVMAIDPGSEKCGVAVVQRAAGSPFDPDRLFLTLHRCVVRSCDIGEVAAGLAERFSPELVLIGNGTSSSRAARAIEEINIAPIELVNEENTSMLARKRYFKENPPRGLRRLIPASLQTPPCPYDDYAAILLAERYLASQSRQTHP